MNQNCNKRRLKHVLALMPVLFFLLLQPKLLAFTLNVQDSSGNPVSGFRWLVEEDTTHPVTPGALVADSLAVGIHKSYAPVVMKGHSDSNTADVNVPADRRYVVSVLPDAGYSISGQNVKIDQNSVIVKVNLLPLPTAQISIFVFHDKNPIDNSPGVFGVAGAEEQPLEGFSILLADGAGHQVMDAFGNMVGTTYMTDPVTGEYILDGEGNPIVDQMGNMIVQTDANGEALIKNLAPGKYAIQVVPPADETDWIQTTTIEGTHTIDAWVRANEPTRLFEFGPAFYHIFMGFTKQFNDLYTVTPLDANTTTITGRAVYTHIARPPLALFYPGIPIPNAWIALNSITTGTGLYAGPCNADSTFTIEGVPPGTYQLVIWDENLDAIISFSSVIVPPGGGLLDVGDLSAPAWFGTLKGSVFIDADEDGFRDPEEMGLRNQAVNIRFRDGTIYQATETDPMGEYEFEEVFPFFKWLVVEVDFARFNATGMTSVVDYGGEIPLDMGWDMPSFNQLNPQPQAEINPNTGNNWSRTETGVVLTEAMQLYAGQTNIIDWGKAPYAAGTNGGISGIVFYATTRAEDDPRYAGGEEWEPGIPNVQVALYSDSDCDGVIDDLDEDGGPTLADRDNYPLGWLDDPLNPAAKGPEDVDRNGNGLFDPGDAIQITHTDSWDDNFPTGSIQPQIFIHGQPVAGNFDNIGNWNQVRPGIFDGGYAFTSYYPNGIASGSSELEGLPTGTYIVEAATPLGYEIVKEEDKNVDFGDTFTPSLLLLPPVCVGDLHLVPDELSLFPGVECAYAGQWRPLADRKQIIVADGKNAAADFFLFTEVPKAARAVGTINNDLAAELDPCSPVFGEKAGPSWIPISFRDYTGKIEYARVYSDEFGAYNALLPSTFTNSMPAPSGMSPQMITILLNHPGPIPDPDNPGEMIIDPYYDSDFSTTGYTFNFLPGTTTYLDTPVIPLAAFIGYPNRTLDIEPADGSPVIYSVEGPSGGPIVCTDGAAVTITSVGSKEVPNPDYVLNDPCSTQLITRDFGFGNTEGTVTVGDASLNIISWTDANIVATVDFGTVSTGTLHVTRGDNDLSTDLGITLHVGGCDNVIYVSGGAYYPATPIQDAIDAAPDGALIIVRPGTYWENPIVWKNVSLQGSGAPSTIIYGLPVPTDRSEEWHNKIRSLLDNNDILLPASEVAAPFDRTASPTILVVANVHGYSSSAPGLIDGFELTGSISGGGILVRDAEYLNITNNKIRSNLGTSGGGIVVGALGDEANVGIMNNNLNISHNVIAKNAGIIGGGGVTIFGGADDYAVTDNFIIGNLSRWKGGGVLHYGLSNNGLIARNRVVSNEVTSGDQIGGDGGGVYVSGLQGLSNLGAGNVTLLSNLIQGNLAGSGSGGGFSVQYFNDQDVTSSIDPNDWYQLNIFNNIVVNNVAAFYGGGMFLKDAVKVNVINNTVANNDNTSTAANAFQAGALQSTPQPAGIVTGVHSAVLATATGQTYTNPVLRENIVWGNRSLYWDSSLNDGKGGLAPHPTIPFWDLAVVGLPDGTYLDPNNCLLTALIYGDGANYNDGTNVAANPDFVDGYNNILTAVAIPEEGGNFVTIRFEPIGLRGNYHINAGSPAVDIGGGAFLGVFAELAADIDGQVRPQGAGVDMGADEVSLLEAAGLLVAGELDENKVTLLIDAWLTENLPFQPNGGDLNADGTVNITEQAAFVAQHPQVALLAEGVAAGSVYLQGAEDTDGIDTDGDGDPDNDNVVLGLAAGDGFINMADGKLQYTFGFSDVTGISDENIIMNTVLGATFPSPTIVVKEGQKLYLNLTNVGMMVRPDLFDPHTVHWHGFPQAATIFDGVPDVSVSINMGATLTYFYNVVEPGTYMYHCHVEATEHMQMGMLGQLYVQPIQNNLPDGTVLNPDAQKKDQIVHHAGDKYVYNDGDASTYYDVEYPIQIAAFDPDFHDASLSVQPLPFANMDDKYPMLNGRGYPDTVNPNVLWNTASDEGYMDRPSQKISSLITATKGEKILLRISSLSTTSFHTLTVPGIPMKVVGTGSRMLKGPGGDATSYMTNSVDLGGGQAFDVILDTTNVQPGTYVLYSTNLNHLSNNEEDYGGMMTEIVISP